jgi:hypothetical protein
VASCRRLVQPMQVTGAALCIRCGTPTAAKNAKKILLRVHDERTVDETKGDRGEKRPQLSFAATSTSTAQAQNSCGSRRAFA